MKSVMKLIIGLMGVIILSGCGPTDPALAPWGSKVFMVPSTYDLKTNTCFLDSGVYVDSFFDIHVVGPDYDDEEHALNGVEVDIYLDFGPDQMNISPPFITLLDEDGRVVDSPFVAKTGQQGIYTVGVRVELGLSFECNLTASIGYNNALAHIKQDVEVFTADECREAGWWE